MARCMAIFAVAFLFLVSPAAAQPDPVSARYQELEQMALEGKKSEKHPLTCIDYGCYLPYDEGSTCQCNVKCEKYNDCCPDYWHMCTETNYSKSGRKSNDPLAPLPDHHKNTHGTTFTTGFIRNIKVANVDNTSDSNRIIIGYQGLGKLYVREHRKGYDVVLKEIAGKTRPGHETPGPSRVDQIRKWGNRDCWYAEYPAPKEWPFEISVDGKTTEHTGPTLGKVKKPDVEAHIYAKFDKDGIVEFARNRNFEPAILKLEKEAIPIGRSYKDHPEQNSRPHVPSPYLDGTHAPDHEEL